MGALKNWVPYIESKNNSEIDITVIQGQKDETVDWLHNLSILEEKFRHVNVVYVPQGHHQLVNEIKELREEIFNAIGTGLDKT